MSSNVDPENILQKIDQAEKKSLARQKRTAELAEMSTMESLEYFYSHLEIAQERGGIISTAMGKLREKLETGDEFEISADFLLKAVVALSKNASDDVGNIVQLLKAERDNNQEQPQSSPSPQNKQEDEYNKELAEMSKEEKATRKKIFEKLKALEEIEKGVDTNDFELGKTET
jgi:hypothetical protein